MVCSDEDEILLAIQRQQPFLIASPVIKLYLKGTWLITSAKRSSRSQPLFTPNYDHLIIGVLGADGMKYLSKALSMNTTLTQLDLGSTQ